MHLNPPTYTAKLACITKRSLRATLSLSEIHAFKAPNGFGASVAYEGESLLDARQGYRPDLCRGKSMAPAPHPTALGAAGWLEYKVEDVEIISEKCLYRTYIAGKNGHILLYIKKMIYEAHKELKTYTNLIRWQARDVSGFDTLRLYKLRDCLSVSGKAQDAS